MRRRDFGTVFQRPGKPGWYCRFVADGRVIQRRAGTERKHATEKLAAAQSLLDSCETLEVTLARVFKDVIGADMTFRTAVPLYREYSKTRKRESTLATDERHFAVVLKTATWSGKTLSLVSPRDIETWVDARLNDGVSGATVNRQATLSSALYRWAIRAGHVESNPFRKIAKLRESRGRETYLGAAECRALLASASADFRPLLHAALATGCRRGELLKLLWSDVDFGRSEIVVRPENAKSGRSRVIPLTPALRCDLLALAERRKVIPLDPDAQGTAPDFVFRQSDGRCGTGDYVKGALKRAVRACDAIPPEKKPKVTMHVMRHTFASLAVASNVSVFDVAKLLGHADCRLVSARYGHFAPQSARLAVDKIGAALEIGGEATEGAQVAVAGGGK